MGGATSVPQDQSIIPDSQAINTNPLAANTGENLSAFSFGDNRGAKPIGERDNDAEHTANVCTRRATTTMTRREGVSADPILPDAAEKFVPRRISKDATVKQQLMSVVKGNPLFAALEEEELSTVIDAMEMESFSKGTNVLREGEPGTEKFYFLIEGTVDVLKHTMGYICSFGPGQTFGEMELMYLTPCAATVQCKTDVTAFAIDRNTYRHIVMMVSIRKRKKYIAYLQHVDFLAHMSTYELTTLADALETQQFAHGDVLIPFGSQGEWMYFVTDGQVKVVGRDKSTGKKVDVCTFGAGDIIGELEFLNNHKAVADVLAVGDVKTCRLHRAHFEMCMGPVVDYMRVHTDNSAKFAYYNTITEDDGTGNKKLLTDFTFGDPSERNPDSENAFANAFSPFDGDDQAQDAGDDGGNKEPSSSPKSRRIGVSDEVMAHDDTWKPPVYAKNDEDMNLLQKALRQNTLMKSLEAADFETVVLAMKKHSFTTGSLIMTQGAEGEASHYYIISEGVVDILTHNSYICSLTEGQGFGELELMYVQPVVASVKARSNVTAWSLDRVTYKRLVMAIAIQRRAVYSELVGNLDFLQGMTEYEKGTLADALSPTHFKPGATIVRRGERNEWMYIIISGKVEVLGVGDSQDEEAAATTHICFIERGSCVGELEFLNQHPAVANCVAHSEVQACMLHRDHFELCMGPILDVLRKTVRQDKYAYYNTHVEDFAADNESSTTAAAVASRGRVRGNAVSAEVYDAATDADYVPPVVTKQPAQLAQLSTTVKRCPLFSALNAEERAVVIGALEPVTLAPNTKIFAEGTVPEDPFWYIIQEGAVQQTNDAGKTVVATLQSGQSFGEFELMYSTQTQATTAVSGTSSLQAYRLKRRSYRKLVMAACQERRRLYRELLAGVPFAALLSEQQSLGLADALTPIKFPPGDVLIKFGDQNEWMYIIVDGVVEVFHANLKDKVCDLRRGEMVGELEFLNTHAAVANCVAKTHVQALRLHRDHFEAALGPCAAFIQATLTKPKYAYYNALRTKSKK